MQPDARHPDRPFDIVVVGATGFTGKLVVEYLARHYPVGEPLRWAVAGRDRQKLDAVVARRCQGGKPPATLIADSHDAASLHELARQAKVVLTTVGPYAQHGSELVAACVELGTDYVDLAGETQWVHAMIERHQTAARTSGARIVPSCGFDSIPSDLGVFYLQRESMIRYGVPCCEIQLLVRGLKGGASGGTFASMLNVLDESRRDPAVAKIMANPYSLNPAGSMNGPDGHDQRGIRYSRAAHCWTAPFVMAAINTRVVRRTNALLEFRYGRDFRYSEATATGRGLRGWSRAAGMTAGLGLFMLGCSFGITRRTIVRTMLPPQGAGPSREQRESGHFDMRLFGSTREGDKVTVRVAGDRDPGYGSTSKMLAESAICLVTGSIKLAGGFWTPSSAMAEPLINRLVANAGLTFESVA